MDKLNKQYELVQTLYPVSQNEESLFSSLTLWIECFAEKRYCAYDLHTDQIRLIRKERRVFEQLVKTILQKLAVQEMDPTLTIKPLVLLSQILDDLEKRLKETYPENSSIEFGNFGIEGAIQLAEVNAVQRKHSQVILQSVWANLMEEDEEEFLDWRE